MNIQLRNTATWRQGPIYALAIIGSDEQRSSYNGGETRDDETASEQPRKTPSYPKGEEKNIPRKHHPDSESEQEPDELEKEAETDDAAGPGQAGIEGDESDTDTDLIDTPRPDRDNRRTHRGLEDSRVDTI